MTLTLHQLTYERNDRAVFAPVSFTLHPGKLLQITGINGVGKSTLLRLLAKLIQPTTGSIQSISDYHYIGHQNGHHALFTARENLIFTANILNQPYSEKLLFNILKQAGLEKLMDTPVKYFSAGQARRLALAKLLLKPCQLWLLDEPITALDISAQHWFIKILQQHLAQGGMAVIATHDVIENISNNKILELEKDLRFSGRSFVTKYVPQDDSHDKNGSNHKDNTCHPEQTAFKSVKDLHRLTVLIYYEMLATCRSAYAWMMPFIFFVIALTLFPLAVGPDINLLHNIAPGIIWVITLLSILLSMDTVFRADFETGRLDFILSQPYALKSFVLIKIITYWLLYAFPFILLSPLIGVSFNLSFSEIKILSFSLFIGTWGLSLIGIAGAALVAGLRNQNILLPILIMPLYIPILIFGTNMITAHHQPLLSASSAMIIGLTLLTAIFAPFFTQMALKIGGD